MIQMVNYLDDKRWKANLIDYNVWSSLALAPEDTPQTAMICVTPQEASVLIAGISAYRWRTRWLNAPESFDMSEVIDQLESKLNCNDGCCETVLHCIQTSEAIQDAIRDSSSGDKNTPLNTGVPSLASCNEDIIFGAVSELVRYINRAITDAYEQIELATNAIELIAEWMDNIPLIGGAWATLPEFIAFVQDSLKEAYDAGYTVALEDEMRCDYLCLYLEDCSITTQQLFEYHFNKAFAVPQPDNIFELLVLVYNNSWVGELSVHVSYAVAYGFLWLGDSLNNSIPFLSIPTVRAIKIPLAVGANTPDTTWTLLCDACTFCTVFDFADENHGYVLDAGFAGGYVVDNYWQVAGDPQTSSPGMQISKAIAPVTAVSIDMSYSVRWGSLSNVSRNVRVRAYDNGVQVGEEIATNSGTTTGNLVLNFGTPATIDKIELFVSAGSTGSGAYARILSVEVCNQ